MHSTAFLFTLSYATKKKKHPESSFNFIQLFLLFFDSCRHCHRHLFVLPRVEEFEDYGVVQKHDSAGRDKNSWMEEKLPFLSTWINWKRVWKNWCIKRRHTCTLNHSIQNFNAQNGCLRVLSINYQLIRLCFNCTLNSFLSLVRYRYS